MRTFGIILIFFIMLVLVVKASEYERDCCSVGTATDVSVASLITAPCIGGFDHSSELMNRYSESSVTVDSIVRLLDDTGTLTITGQYDRSETNTTTYDDLGLARAYTLKEVFQNFLTEEQIKIKSQEKKNDDNECDLQYQLHYSK